MTLGKNSISITSPNKRIHQEKLVKVLFSTIIATLTSFLFGFTITCSNFLIKAYEEKKKNKISTAFNSAIKSIPFIGAFFGNITIPNMNITRKSVITLSGFVFLLGGIIQSLRINIWLLVFGRFLAGLSIGSSCSAVPNYIVEIVAIEHRGIFSSMVQFQICIGVLSGYLFTNFFSNYNANYGYFTVIAFMSAAFVFSNFILEGNSESPQSQKSVSDLLVNPLSFRSIFSACVFHMMQQLSGINVLIVHAMTIVERKGGSKYTDVYIGLLNIFTTIGFMFIIEKIGRKPLMILSIVVSSVSLLGIIFTNYISLFMYLFMIGYGFGLGPITWIITSEIFPLEYQAAGNTLGVSMNWIFTFLVIISTQSLINMLGIKLFFINVGLLILYFFYILFFYKETKGKRPEFQA